MYCLSFLWRKRKVETARCDILVVSSCGGHLKQILDLKPSYSQHKVYFAINDKYSVPEELKESAFRIVHAERNLLQIVHFFEALAILLIARPKILLSAGAAPIVIFCLIGKLFGTKTIFIESFSRLTSPSLTGKIMYRLADIFYYQWETLNEFFPKGKFEGSIL
jgi:UDP-N-acetylglucosamine:LPS N-acetylglucosamine transferase